MGRFLIALAGLMVSLSFLGGCAAPKMQNPFEMIRRITFAKPAESSEAAEEKKIAEKNPFRSRADAIAAREKAAESKGVSRTSRKSQARHGPDSRAEPGCCRKVRYAEEFALCVIKILQIDTVQPFVFNDRKGSSFTALSQQFPFLLML